MEKSVHSSLTLPKTRWKPHRSGGMVMLKDPVRPETPTRDRSGPDAPSQCQDSVNVSQEARLPPRRKGRKGRGRSPDM